MCCELNGLLAEIEFELVSGSMDVRIGGICFDSRQVKAGDMFVAVRGVHTDGHKFVTTAIGNGAIAIVYDDEACRGEAAGGTLTWIRVANSSKVLGLLAAAFYGQPSRKMKVIGVTGTNGKTTIATLLYRLFKGLGHKAGLISTIRYYIDDEELPATHTTPDALRIQRMMSAMAERGCEYCFMEVSSHAADQERIAGMTFAGAIFTNITHDHLDYHKTFAEYLKAKKKFFDNLPASAFALTNADEKNGMVVLQNTKARKSTYALKSIADFKGRMLEKHIDGMLLEIGGNEFWTHLSGEFNAYNIMAVYGAAVLAGENADDVLSALSALKPVEGRFEIIRSADGKFAIVDYAHTPDALKNVLKGIKEIRSGKEKVITVVGAGGDRDKTKRPEMAREAVSGSDRVILTSDNPRTETPELIIKDMEAGVEQRKKTKVVSIANRREAIRTACILANPGDIILIAGKGHEDYQEINGVKHHFSDREVVNEEFGIDR